ncbi:hypothetical protein ACFFX0_24110 [Citricoccus parietis]|uniref:Uncharacterized protein n=1 Tax=Citricoccus parietis TaxID=592307 RepID=A0ABV5G6R8_9MICC
MRRRTVDSDRPRSSATSEMDRRGLAGRLDKNASRARLVSAAREAEQ